MRAGRFVEARAAPALCRRPAVAQCSPTPGAWPLLSLQRGNSRVPAAHRQHYRAKSFPTAGFKVGNPAQFYR